MKRAGFTMIELIFVIVLLGILSAVALPKFIGVSEQAQAAKCQAMVGTFNRTVGPALWSSSLMKNKGGTLLTTWTDADGLQAEIEKQIDVPTECGGDASNYVIAAGTTITIGGKVYDINFTDGNSTSAPVWGWKEQ